MSETKPEKKTPTDTDVSRLQLERRHDGQLWLLRDGHDGTAVRARPCFPWTHPGRYVSLRDSDDKELVLIHDLDESPDEARRLVVEALAEVGFVLEITRVLSLQNEFEIRNWKVETRQGPSTFQTKLDDWPHKLAEGGLLIRDVADNLFVIPEPGALDAHSRKLLWAFVD